jgi:DNA-binding CsgD family transcriptional regulator
MAFNPKEIYEASILVNEMLASLTPREANLVTLRLVHGYADAEIARFFSITDVEVRVEVRKALRKLRDPSRLEQLKSLEDLKQSQEEELQGHTSSEIIPVELVDIIETVSKLTPSLISHLQSHTTDLGKLPWDVFEHLVAEFFASWEFVDVRLVGRNSSTSADIFAARKIAPIGTLIKYFIEVKRWNKKVGVNVIDHVYGAMINEKPKFGWHAGMIVSLVGFKDFKKYTREAVVNMGIELKDRNDLLRWLKEYQPNRHGLWLPNPLTLL